MSNLRLDPQHAKQWDDKRKRDELVWFYEEPEGINVCFDHGSGAHLTLIPLKAIREYMERINE